MKTVFFTLLFASSILISCNRPELRVDSYFATAVLVGREVCPTDTSISYWIFNVIRIGPSIHRADSTNAAWGKPITLNNTLYKRAIKFRSLPVRYVTPPTSYKPVFFSQKYSLEYDLYSGLELGCLRNNQVSTLTEVTLLGMGLAD